MCKQSALYINDTKITIFNIDNNKNYQHIRMISEGSCDPEGCSNDAENSASHHRNKWHFTIYLHRNTLLR